MGRPMRFAGPCNNKTNWYCNEPLRIIVESADEVTDHYRRYWSNNVCVVQTSSQAVIGDVRQIIIELPNSVEIRLEGLIDSTKTLAQGAQLSVFRFNGLPDTDKRMIDVYLDSTSTLGTSSSHFSSHMELDEITIEPASPNFVPLGDDDDEFLSLPDNEGQTDFTVADESTTDFEFSHEEELLPTFATEVDDEWVANLRRDPEGVTQKCKPSLPPAGNSWIASLVCWPPFPNWWRQRICLFPCSCSIICFPCSMKSRPIRRRFWKNSLVWR